MFQRLAGAYLIAVSVAVAAYFIINPLHAASYDPERVWYVLDILMVVAAVPALVFNTRRKLSAGRAAKVGPLASSYWEANIAFYATVGVTILLLHSWFSILALGLDADDHQGFVKWAIVDTLLPLVYGATGWALWRAGGRPVA
ncbi:MAG: hypothetical protein OXL97_04335 [Chloroflexota bacterium]|nr:hypothetical protein [Chloroflexota bacterium]MDE2883939.1 hypothetical protein [Chloroflexota bacterium]